MESSCRSARSLILSLGTGLALAGALGLAQAQDSDQEPPPGLRWREVRNDGRDQPMPPIPPEAVQVFTHEGEPRTVHVGDEGIAVDYGPSGVLFDRASGGVSRRFTVVEGWPGMFGPPIARRSWAMVGPGVVESSNLRDIANDETEEQMRLPIVAASTFFDARGWRAVQPRGFLWDFVEKVEDETSWTAILTRLNEQSYVEAVPAGDRPAVRFTMKQGLASNVVTRIVVADGMLWAACVDIYDPAKGAWGPGGLCRFDPWKDRWERVPTIDGHPVRWVTLLDVVAGDLWVGFREGDGVAGDSVICGKGIIPEVYRPRTTAVVLARWAGGRWNAFARAPVPDNLPARSGEEQGQATPSTETPHQLGRTGKHVLLASTMDRAGRSGTWHTDSRLHISILDLETSRWSHVAEDRELGARTIEGFHAESGEILIVSERGVHRWVAARGGWQFLDPRSGLPHRTIRALAVAGEEVWVATESGIDRYNERTGRWSQMGPAELGTACPVRRIVALPSGDVWVLFQPWYSLAQRPGPTNRHPTGLGRYSAGKWEFPVRIDGAPETDPANNRLTRGRGPIEHLAAGGDRLFVGTTSGVYQGPAPWTRIVWEPVDLIVPAERPEAVQFLRAAVPVREGTRGLQRGRLDPATGHIVFDHVAADRGEDPMTLKLRASTPMNGHWTLGWYDDWVQVPTKRPGSWAIGPMNTSRTHTVIASPKAIWIASPGELVRLERDRLEAKQPASSH